MNRVLGNITPEFILLHFKRHLTVVKDIVKPAKLDNSVLLKKGDVVQYTYTLTY